MEFYRYGEDGIRFVFGSQIDLAINKKVREFYFFVRSLNLTDIKNIIPSFSTCVIHFDCARTSFDRVLESIMSKLDQLSSMELPAPSFHEILVRYGGEHGPDMGFVCDYTGLTEQEIIEIHTSITYTVFAVGFMPGFPYLGVLDQRISVPRLVSPRVKVPKGSVGIAQLQTGIYPFESPGGWQIIGRTDAVMFDHTRPPYSLMKIGDLVRFYSL